MDLDPKHWQKVTLVDFNDVTKDRLCTLKEERREIEISLQAKNTSGWSPVHPILALNLII